LAKRRKLIQLQSETGPVRGGQLEECTDHVAFDDENVLLEPPQIGEDIELLEEPRKIEQIKINYVKCAKIVDIKALKDTIWSLIESDRSDPTQAKPFSELLSKIPDHLFGESLQNVSVPFCFICLLHLANEKGLVIDQQRNQLNELSVTLQRTVN